MASGTTSVRRTKPVGACSGAGALGAQAAIIARAAAKRSIFFISNYILIFVLLHFFCFVWLRNEAIFFD